jgi:hypothetical protein
MIERDNDPENKTPQGQLALVKILEKNMGKRISS